MSCIVFYKDAEMLAQGQVKRAKTTTGDEPQASNVADPEIVVIIPELSLRHCPQRSPNRESITHFPLVSVGVEVFIAEIC